MLTYNSSKPRWEQRITAAFLSSVPQNSAEPSVRQISSTVAPSDSVAVTVLLDLPLLALPTFVADSSALSWFLE